MSGDSTVPDELAAHMGRAWQYYERRFANFQRDPDEGWIRVDKERFVLLRCESLYLGLFDGMAARYGDDAAFEMIYTIARDIGRADCAEINARMGQTDPIAKLVAGPPFFAFCGWAGVEFLPDCVMDNTPACFLHYRHPNTFESEILAKRADIEVKNPACLFSAGYSAGWATGSLRRDMSAREIKCVACGDDTCEFVMAPTERLEGHLSRLGAPQGRA